MARKSRRSRSRSRRRRQSGGDNLPVIDVNQEQFLALQNNDDVILTADEMKINALDATGSAEANTLFGNNGSNTILNHNNFFHGAILTEAGVLPESVANLAKTAAPKPVGEGQGQGEEAGSVEVVSVADGNEAGKGGRRHRRRKSRRKSKKRRSSKKRRKSKKRGGRRRKSRRRRRR